jgi:ferrous iron transport protein B
MMIPAFFPLAWRARVLWTLNIIGILLALLSAKLIRVTVLRGESTPFVMELPPYRMPTVRGVAIHTWERAYLYVKKAGTIILAVSIILWALTSYPKSREVEEKCDGDMARIRETLGTEGAAGKEPALLESSRRFSGKKRRRCSPTPPRDESGVF